MLRQAHRRAVSLRSARDPELRRAIIARVLFELRTATQAATGRQQERRFHAEIGLEAPLELRTATQAAGARQQERRA